MTYVTVARRFLPRGFSPIGASPKGLFTDTPLRVVS